MVGEIARLLGEVADQVDAGDLAAPRWLRDRVRAAQVALDATRPPAMGSGGRDGVRDATPARR